MYSFMYLFVTQVLRRPTPNREANIGVWQEILTCLVYLSVSSLAAALHLHLHSIRFLDCILAAAVRCCSD
jgi:uncharacterized membrane protein